MKNGSSIKNIEKKRRKLGWTIKELAEKANVPYSAVLRIEKGINKWPEYLTAIIKALKEGLKEDYEIKWEKKNKIKNPFNIVFNYDALDYELTNKINNQVNTQSETIEETKPLSKYYIDIDDIDLKVYFPNLSEGEKRRLFGDSIKNKWEKSGTIVPKIKFRAVDRVNRLGEALKHARQLAESFEQEKQKNPNKRKIPIEYFVPNFNPAACRWFEIFDNVNNTKGLYATRGGEYYIEELGFFPDYFNPELKLIMEWDESHHFINGELSFQDIERQEVIQRLFSDYEFIRIREDDFKEYLDL